jgi:hypothetical protein
MRPGLLGPCISAPCRAAVDGYGGKGGNGLRNRAPHGAADHAHPSSTVGSSPGAAKKRIPGVFSFRTSDEDYEQFYCVCGPPPMVGHPDHPTLPVYGSTDHRIRSYEAGAIRLPAASCATATLRRAAYGPAEAILGPLEGGLCMILQATFQEKAFHALR